MGFLQDVIKHQSGTECPESFTTWSSLSLLGAVLGRKVWVSHGDYWQIYPNLYICLVGTPGSGKSTAKDFSRKIMIHTFPDYFLNADVQSFQDVAKQMARDECIRTWHDDKGELQVYRPFYCLVDELSLFLETNMGGMLQFLTRLFTADDFSTGFKKEAEMGANQKFFNPFFSFLACTIPDWIMTNLRLDLFQGGLGRRLIIIHDRKTRLIDTPMKPVGADAVYSRIVSHLVEAHHEKTHGEIRKSKAALLFWKEWYHAHHKALESVTDPILFQFGETEHIQVLKIASILAMNELPFKYEMTDEHLQFAIALLNVSKTMVVKLTSGVGRNELAGIGAQVIDFIERLGGMVDFVMLRVHFRRFLQQKEFWDILTDFEATKQLMVAEFDGKKFIGTPEKLGPMVEAVRKKTLMEGLTKS